MEVIILETPGQVAFAAAERIASAVLESPAAVLGFATGSSPLGIYAELAARVRAGELDFGAATGFALDEYVGLPPTDPRSYAAVIAAEVTAPLGMSPQRMHVPDGDASDLDAACESYEAAIEAAGGIDVQILGIGTNGHIGFNEPTSSFASRTRVKTLARQTISDNARFFEADEQVPTHCVTQGLGTILRSRAIILVANGLSKSDAVAALVEGPMTSMCPASVLQAHPNVVVLVDRAAGSKLRLTDYYEHVQEKKPRKKPYSP
jgi:glucosamine-6-phosphate deaminase